MREYSENYSWAGLYMYNWAESSETAGARAYHWSATHSDHLNNISKFNSNTKCAITTYAEFWCEWLSHQTISCKLICTFYFVWLQLHKHYFIHYFFIWNLNALNTCRSTVSTNMKTHACINQSRWHADSDGTILSLTW